MVHFIKKDFIAVDKNDSISHLIGQMKLRGVKSAVIFDKGKFIGVADVRLLIKTKINPVKTKVATVVRTVPTLHGKEDLRELISIMIKADMNMLPVVKDKRVEGVVIAKDLLVEVRKKKVARKKITECCTLSPITLHENDGVGKAIEILKTKGISRIPIVDDKGDLLNISSISDFIYEFILTQQDKTESRGRGSPVQMGNRTIRAFRQKIDMNKYPIKNLSSSIIVTASPDETIGKIIDKMERFSISSIVIVEYKKPIGIVTIRDILKFFLKIHSNI